VVSASTLIDRVPKVPEGCSEGFCHYWHLAELGTEELRRFGMDISLGVLSTFLAYHVDLGGDVVALLDVVHAF
jgi:hypothetical protein